jgi:putative transposase
MTPVAIKTHYSAAELATMRLPGLPTTSGKIIAKGERDRWVFNEVNGRGGLRREYAPPAEVMTAIYQKAVQHAAPALVTPETTAVTVVTPVDAHSLSTRQLTVEQARDRLVAFIQGHPQGAKAAVAWINSEKAAGTLAGPMVWALANAWDKPRAGQTLTSKTYYNWLVQKKEFGRCAPKKPAKDMTILPWHVLAISLKQRPQGSMMVWIAEQIAEQWQADWGDAPPSVRAVTYFFKEKFSALDQLKGRHTGSALRSHMASTPRTNAGLLPWHIVHADGWNTHFTAPHPVSGEYVTYEVWHAHDVSTRFVPPYGIGLTENFEVISSCIENAIRFGGVFAFLQTDSTGVIKNSERLKTNVATSLADRAGFTIIHPVEVGNSQANGIAENFNKYMDRCSRELATYQSKDMDSLTLKRVKKITAKMVVASNKGDLAERAKLKREAERMGKGKVFDSYAEAIAWLEAKRAKFNNKPHSSLPQIRDAVSGKRRHQSPQEALDAAKAAGWQPVMIDELHLVDMFWQHTQRKVRRATVQPYGKMQFSHTDLAAWEGQLVTVAFDENSSEHVWVKDNHGAIICEALAVKATPYASQTALEAAIEKRALAVIARNNKKNELIRQRIPGTVLENEGDFIETPRLQTIADFIDVVPHQVPEAKLNILDFLPEKKEEEKLMSFNDTMMWLQEGKDEIAQKNAAA